MPKFEQDLMVKNTIKMEPLDGLYVTNNTSSEIFQYISYVHTINSFVTILVFITLFIILLLYYVSHKINYIIQFIRNTKDHAENTYTEDYVTNTHHLNNNTLRSRTHQAIDLMHQAI